MERSAPYALIATFVLLGLAVAAGLLIWLSDYDPWRRTASYAVVFGDVSGLGIASEVRYNGLPVGEVSDMALDPAGSGLIRVVIEVLEDVPLRQGSNCGSAHIRQTEHTHAIIFCPEPLPRHRPVWLLLL